MKEYKCKYCGKETKPLGLAPHQRLCAANPESSKESHPKYGKKGSNHYSKGAKMTDETKNKLSAKASGRKLSEDHRSKISIAMKKAVRKYPDSYSASNVSGRTKTYEYNGFKLKGTWELAVAHWLDLNNIKWTNKIEPIEYTWNDSSHLYFPDFYLPELDLYIEVKGYQRDRDLQKWKEVDNLLIIRAKEIKEIKNNTFTIK